MSPVEQQPLEERARRLAKQGGPSGPAMRFVLSGLDEARAEIDRLNALTSEMARRKTLGGIPPQPDTTWANRGLDGGPEPEFAGLGDAS